MIFVRALDKVTKGYHRLIVWQKAKELVVLVYKLTDGFPRSEEFGLKSQMRRAAISIISNIAEGYSRSSKKDNKRFVEIATGSLFELESDIEISVELNLISSDELDLIENKRAEVGFLLHRYLKSL